MKTITVAAPAVQSWGEVVALEPRYAAMVARLERHAARDTAGYGRRVLAAGLAGYVFLVGLLTLFIGLAIAMVVLMILTRTGIAAEIKGLIIFGGVGWALLSALWLARFVPTGIAVAEDEAPALFALIARVREAIGGVRVHAVYLTEDFNAAITQDSRLFGLAARNILYLGLPLLSALDEDEVAAVIAHEMGHFAGRHGRSAGFVYGVRRRWLQVADRLPDGIVAGWLKRFFGWYGPWFAAYSFVLARRQEYEADAVSARVAGAEVSGRALKRVALLSARHSQGWDLIWEQSLLRPDPPSSPFTTMRGALAETADDADAEALAAMLARGADLDDTHPSLAERLAALGASDPAAPPPPCVPAAAALLGGALARATDRFDADWHDWADAHWAGLYEGRQAERAERDALAPDVEEGTAERAAAFRHAELTEWIDGAPAAVPFWAALAVRFPEASDIRLRHGLALLAADDDAGITRLAELAEQDADFAVYAWRSIVAYLERQGRWDEAATHAGTLAGWEVHETHASAESGSIDERTAFYPLDDARREQVAALVAGIDGLVGLEAGLRDLAHRTQPQIVFTFAAAKDHAGAAVLDTLIDALLPMGDLIGIERSRQRRWLTRRLQSLPGGRIV